MLLGGPLDLLQSLQNAHATPGPASYWIGTWNDTSGYGDYDIFLAACASQQHRPLVQFWRFGDTITPAGVQQGMTAWLQQATLIAGHAKQHGTTPLWVLETEWNKNGVETWDGWSAAYRQVADTLRAQCPGSEVVFAPGGWGDVASLVARHAAALVASDRFATQCLYATPRSSMANYAAGPDVTLGVLQTIQAHPAAIGKKSLVTDLAFSSYGGNASSSPPFAGGDGASNEAAQGAAFDRLTSLRPQFAQANCTAFILRELRDDPAFDPANYFGYAEQHWGLERADGSSKPAYAAALRLAQPLVVPPPDTVPRAQYDAVVGERDALAGKIARAQQDLA